MCWVETAPRPAPMNRSSEGRVRGGLQAPAEHLLGAEAGGLGVPWVLGLAKISGGWVARNRKSKSTQRAETQRNDVVPLLPRNVFSLVSFRGARGFPGPFRDTRACLGRLQTV